MPFAQLADVRLHYQFDGDPRLPVLMLCNSLGTTLDMWEPQMPAFLAQFRVLRYDTRGHGQSEVTPGEYSIAQLGKDALALLDHLGIERMSFCGLSMGGMTGMWLGVNCPERIWRLVLCNTGAKLGDPALWAARFEAVRSGGMAAITPSTLDRWFTARYQRLAPKDVDKVRAMLLATSPDGYIANGAAVRDMDQRADLAKIRVPTLVIAGTYDGSTPPELGREVAQAIDGARYVELDAAHLSNWEQTGAFSSAVLSFVLDGGPNERARFEAGLSVRRPVLGAEYVDRSLANRTAVSAEFQDLITRYCWGEVWTRPGLTRHTRSLLTIAFTLALNRPDELRLHMRAARNNGVTRDEIKETLMHAAIYCGVPAGVSAFKIANEVFAEQDAAGAQGDTK
jgi:3-oxoadipate enol-lactonase / 4-carboxymuconolactone decarboxylase